MGKSKIRVIGCGLAAVVSVSMFSAPLKAEPDSPTEKRSPHDAKAEAMARVSARKAVNQAVAALTKEYEAHSNDPTAPLREKSNYFTDNPSPEISADAILDAMSQSDGPVAEVCYINWQLLSGLPAKADAKLAPRIGEFYANAPGPVPNPSLTSTDKAQISSQTMRLAADQEEMVNTAWTKHLADWAAQNKPILGYSDALFAMLPEGLGALTLGLQDAYQRRAAAGVDCADLITEVFTESRDWAVNAQPQDLQAAAQECARYSQLYAKGKNFPPAVFTSVKADAQGRQLQWQSMPSKCITLEALNTFVKFLTDQANTAASGGGIQIKPAN